MKPMDPRAVLNNIRLVLECRDIAKLNKRGYGFVCQMSGSISHYSLQGFRQYYANVDDLVLDIAESSDLRDAERYITDRFFVEKDAAYYQSKFDTLKGLRQLVAEYRLDGQVVKGAKFLVINTADSEHYVIAAADATAARHWVINHLDMSRDWTIAPAWGELPLTYGEGR